MNKELPSVEELADDFLADYFDWSEDTDDGKDFRKSIETLTKVINQAITQHTAELKRENERLNERWKEIGNLCKCGCGALDGECANGYREQIDELETQLTEAQSQIVSLREALESLHPEHNTECISRMMVCRTGAEECICGADTGIEIAKEALTTTQPTYLNIRREWREEVIKECIAVIQKDYFHFIAKGTMTEALEELINKEPK